MAINGEVITRHKRPSATVIEQIKKLISSIASQIGVDVSLIIGLVEQESNFDTQAMRYSADNPKDRSYGLMQLTIPTAQDMINRMGLKVQATPELLYKPATNLRLGMTYLKGLLDRYGKVEDAIASYNAGKPIISKQTGSYINLDYVKGVLAKAKKYGYIAIPIVVIIGIGIAIWLFLRKRK